MAVILLESRTDTELVQVSCADCGAFILCLEHDAEAWGWLLSQVHECELVERRGAA